MTQINLSRKTGFSRVKIHRILKNLEEKKLIDKSEYGMTNIIKIKK